MVRYLLGIETTGPFCDVALCDNGEPIWQKAEETRTATETLPGLIDAALKECAARDIALTVIGVAVGPGSFSGTRAGVALAEGLAAALSLPVFGLDSLTLLRWGLPDPATDVAIALDARRGEVYGAIFRQGLEVAAARLWQPAEFVARIAATDRIIGNGAALLHPAGANSPAEARPRAATLGRWLAAHSGAELPPAVPRYVRGAVG